MRLTITTEHRPTTDLGYLLHKNPGRLQEAARAFGRALRHFIAVSPCAAFMRPVFAILALESEPLAQRL
jgi:hypothetical protein